MNLGRREVFRLAAGAAVLPVASRFAIADTYPSHPVRLIIGFTPGAASDVVGRIFAHGAGDVIGQQIVAENKPGAGSSIAAQYVSRAAPDGYTLFLPALSSLTNEIVNPSSPPLDISKDFEPVAQFAEGPFYVVVNPALGVKSLAELVALAKAKPGELTYASVGAGSLPHLCAVLFEQRTGTKWVHVPYPGSPESITDLVANRITMTFAVASSVLGQINAGQIVPLATTGGKHSNVLPNVPTMAEAGIADFEVNLWLGVLAPKGTPAPVIDVLANAAHKAARDPGVVEALHKQGYEALDVGPEEFGVHIRAEIARWTAVVRAAGLKS
jgi:tripartite-type tricarboxylate transporter receptor subunit TctC